MKISALFISSLLLLTSCSSFDFTHRVVQQGNLLPQEKIQRLKIGMSKEDAGILMGSSLLSPMFSRDRWDYAYTWRKGNGPQETRNLTLYFVNNRLSRIEHRP